jgi:hypothetical protein
MKKKSKYKPKGVRLDAVNWVLAGMKKVGALPTAGIGLKLKNHEALASILKGQGPRAHVDVLIHAVNMAEALIRIRDDLGADWANEMKTKYTTKAGLSTAPLGKMERSLINISNFFMPNIYKGLDTIYSANNRSFTEIMADFGKATYSDKASAQGRLEQVYDSMIASYLATQGSLNAFSMLGSKFTNITGDQYVGGFTGLKGTGDNKGEYISYKDLAKKLVYSELNADVTPTSVMNELMKARRFFTTSSMSNDSKELFKTDKIVETLYMLKKGGA